MTLSPATVLARVLLLNLNGYDQPFPVYPLGLAFLDGALREAGHLTRIWDGRMSAESPEDAIESFRPDIIGLSVRNIDNVQYHNPQSFVQEVVEYCARIRAATTAPLVLGGSAFSIFPRELYELTGVDYGIQGEGERTMVRLIACLQTGVPPDHIAGLFHRDAAGAVKCQPAQPADGAFGSEPHHDLGLHYSHFLIFGGPGETVDTIAETLARAHTLPGAYYFTTIGMRIYPDTPLWHLLAPENRGETRADYLPQPRFHLAPGFTVGGLYQQLEEVQREHPNWIVGDPPPEFLITINQLRSRGLRGPLWEYIETLRRLQAPQAATAVRNLSL